MKQKRKSHKVIKEKIPTKNKLKTNYLYKVEKKDVKKKNKKKSYKQFSKKRIIIYISIIIVILALIIIYYTTDLFRTKRSSFYRYFVSAQDSLKMIDTQKFEKYDELKKTKSYIRKGTASIKSSKNIADSNILDKITMNLVEKNNFKSEENNTEFTINSGNDEIEKISFIRNKSLYGVKIPDVSDSYICIKNNDLKEKLKDVNFNNDELIICSIFNNLGIKINDIISNNITDFNLKQFLQINNIQQKHIDEFYKQMKNAIPDTAYEKQFNDKVSFDNESFKVTSYSLNLNKKESANYEVELFNKLARDSILLEFISSKVKLLGISNDFSQVNGLNSWLIEKSKEIQDDENKAVQIKIKVNEYKQKNIETVIEIGENKIVINHLKENDNEKIKFTLNKTFIEYVDKGKNSYSYIIGTDTDEKTRSIEVEYTQTGNIQNNDEKNLYNITIKDGIKTIVFSYKDEMDFSGNIGNMELLSNQNRVVLNDFESRQIAEFIENLKKKVNKVYKNKSTKIGINLDPLFSTSESNTEITTTKASENTNSNENETDKLNNTTLANEIADIRDVESNTGASANDIIDN